MKLFKRDPFGKIVFIKNLLIRTLGIISYRRFRGINHLIIEAKKNGVNKIVLQFFFKRSPGKTRKSLKNPRKSS